MDRGIRPPEQGPEEPGLGLDKVPPSSSSPPCAHPAAEARLPGGEPHSPNDSNQVVEGFVDVERWVLGTGFYLWNIVFGRHFFSLLPGDFPQMHRIDLLTKRIIGNDSLSLTRRMSWWKQSTCSKAVLSVTEKRMGKLSPVRKYCFRKALTFTSRPAGSRTSKMAH